MYEEGREGWEPTDAASDHFLMFGYKIVTCPRRYSHDWISCPYAHSGESARRREPHLYKPIPCPESKGGQPCPRGESCKYAHNDFEYWLHPSRFKTEICKQGPGCSRKVCFFAHQPHEIRKPSDGFMGEHFLTSAFGKHGKKQSLKPSPFDMPFNPHVPLSPHGIASARMKRKAHLQARAEMQLEEALHQLRLSQGPPACLSPRIMGGQQDSWLLPALDGMGYQNPDPLANLHAVLDAPCGTPPTHLMGSGFDGAPLNTWRSPSPHFPTLGFQDGTSRFVPDANSIANSLQIPDSSPGLFTGSPVAPRTPTNKHQMLELGLSGALDSGRHSSPLGMDEGSPVIHMRGFPQRMAGPGRLGSPAGGFSSPGLSSPALSSPGLGSPPGSRSLWAARGGVQDSARMMSHGSLGFGGSNKIAAASPRPGFLSATPSWNLGDSPRLLVGTTDPLGYIQTTGEGLDIPPL
ncbi:hypothetical protein BSKO_06320 [Bryopsis sp. KO-2023]|nr:hypothetical protein BSKO_06320 [Bryopsis sp. KO-2023]